MSEPFDSKYKLFKQIGVPHSGMLECYNSNSEYIDYDGDIVGNPERGIRFVLTYVVEKDRFYAVVEDTADSGFNEEISSVPHDVAKFMVGEEEYNKLKEIHKEQVTLV